MFLIFCFAYFAVWILFWILRNDIEIGGGKKFLINLSAAVFITWLVTTHPELLGLQ